MAFSAEFTERRGCRSGDSVRVAGIRVGTVGNVSLRPDGKVVVDFDVDRGVPLTAGPGPPFTTSTWWVTATWTSSTGQGRRDCWRRDRRYRWIAPHRLSIWTCSLRGLKPVVAGSEPARRQRAELITAAGLPGPGRHAASLLSKTSSFTASLADNRKPSSRSSTT